MNVNPFTSLRRTPAVPAHAAASADVAASQSGLPVIEFTAFTATSRITGRFLLTGDRLTDVLNDAHAPLVISEATLVDLESLDSQSRDRLVISRDDLLVVRATGPTGAPGRRYRTSVHAVSVTIGPYHIEGLIHAGPGAHPILGIYHRRPMIPLTSAVLSYECAGRRIEEVQGSFVIHRDRITSIGLAKDVTALPAPRTLAPPVANGSGDMHVLVPSRIEAHRP
jgi:hypothetical protein